MRSLLIVDVVSPKIIMAPIIYEKLRIKIY